MNYLMEKRNRMNLRKLNIALFVLIFSFSCTNRPKEILSPGDMEDLFFEMYLIDGTIDQRNSLEWISDTASILIYKDLLASYQVTPAVFDSSLVWYGQRPKQMKRIYENLIRRLEEYKKEEFAKIDLEDSLQRINKIISPSVWKYSSAYEMKLDSAVKNLDFTLVDSNFVYLDEYHLKFKFSSEFKDTTARINAGLRIHYADGETDSLYHSLSTDSIERSYVFYMHARRDAVIDSLRADLCVVKGKYKASRKIKFRDVNLIRNYKLKNLPTKE